MVSIVSAPPLVREERGREAAAVITLKNVCKAYGDLEAVKDLSLAIYQGEIFGLLGPNGAGKTTTIEMAVGLRTPTSGYISVLGCDPRTERVALTNKIGMQPQEANLFPTLKVREILRLFASFHRRPLSVEQVLEMLELGEKRKSLVKNLSSGQRQRLQIGLALITDPQLLLLDEPTGSLDPQARRQIWNVIGEFRQRQRTVLLTTHSMEEAETLCDRVAVIDHGQIIALGTPAELVQKHFPIKTLRFTTSVPVEAGSFAQTAGVIDVRIEGRQVELKSEQSDRTLQQLLAHNDYTNFDVRGGSLEDVFLSLTGRALRD